MAASWEELEKAYSVGASTVPSASDPWAELETKYGTPASLVNVEKPAKKETARQDATFVEQAMALPAGVNRGVAGLFGLPVDTAANVIDLGKAGIGYLTSKVTGKAPPEWTELMDRSKVVGSGDWIASRLTKGTKAVSDATGVKLLSPVEPPRPDDAASRILFSSGQFAGSSVNPNPSAKIGAIQQAKNVGGGAIGGIFGGATNEIAPNWAGVASMTPAIATAAVAGATKRVVRGGEDGRKSMQQRTQDLKNGGIDEPSVGLASGNSKIMGLENLLAQTPFTSDLYQVRAQQNMAGMRDKTGSLRDAISSEFGPVVAGDAIQADLKGGFRKRIAATTRALNDRVADIVGSNLTVPVPETMRAAEQLSTPIKGAEATSSQLINQRIANIADNLRADVFGSPAEVRLGPLGMGGHFGHGDVNPTLNTAMSPSVQQRVVANAGLWNIPTEAGAPLPRIAAGNPTISAAQGEAIANSSLWNAPSRPISNPSLWNAPAPTIEPMAQRGGLNPTLNLPLSKAVESVPVANPALWNAEATLANPFPNREVMFRRGTQPSNASLWNTRKEEGIPFAALKALRTNIGEEAASNAIIGTPEQGQFKRLYGAMSEDMRQAVNAADRKNAGVPVGPLMPSQQPGAIALNRANSFYSKAMGRTEELNSLANRNTPEGAFNSVASSLNSGPTIYEKLRGVVDPATRKKIVATIVDDLGRATPGQQTVEGDAWSPRTFLTNFSKLNENGGGDALFKRLPGGQQHADKLRDIAKAAEMVSDGSKIWANPSGTAAALSARGTAAGLLAGAFFEPIMAAGTAGALAVGHQASKRLLLNPKFVNWLSDAPKVKPEQMQVYMQRLSNNAPMWGDKQFQQDVNDYLQSVKDGLQ